jgi:uncharacterized protein (DUF302 family)
VWYVVAGVGGALVGALITDLLMVRALARRMLFESVAEGDVASVSEALEREAKTRGWSVPKVHDLKQTLAKHGYSVPDAQVLELCRPELANEILKRGAERVVSALMPCRIAVYRKPDGRTYVSRLNSGLMSKLLGGVVHQVMSDAAKQSEQLIAAASTDKNAQE